MSDRNNSTQQRVLLKRTLMSLMFIFAFAVAIAPQSAFAQEAPQEPPQENQPAFILPAVCSSEAPSADWSQLQPTTAARTNDPALSWQWTTPTPTEEGSTFSGYSYALYQGETLLINGDLTPADVQYSYTVANDGTFRFYLWLNDTTNVEVGEKEPAPEATAANCAHVDTELERVSPAIEGSTYSQNGNTATPQLSTTETDVVFNWTSNGTNAQVSISDPTALNPIFTFLRDGTYTFELAASDSFGNTTFVSYVITYLIPFIPTPEAPLPIEELPSIDPFIPPTQVLVEAKKAMLDSYNYGTAAYDISNTNTDVDANAVTTPAIVSAPTEAVQQPVAKPIESSNQGWLIMGVPWYWWVLGVGVVLSAVQWYRSGVFRHRADDV